MYSVVFANKVLQRIQNAFTFICKHQLINRQPSTHQPLRAELKGAKSPRRAAGLPVLPQEQGAEDAEDAGALLHREVPLNAEELG